MAPQSQSDPHKVPSSERTAATPPTIAEPAQESTTPVETGQRSLQGIRGWLILAAIGLVLWPLTLVQSLAGNLSAFEPETWRWFTTPGSPAYHPMLATVLVVETAVNVGLLLGSGFLLYLFFTKRRIFPKVVVACIALSLVVALADYAAVAYLCSVLPLARAQLDAGTNRDIGRAVVSAAIWIPYYLRSKRVHATFVR